MSRKTHIPYKGAGYVCEGCGVQVIRRPRTDRTNYCIDCGVMAAADFARFVALVVMPGYRRQRNIDGAADQPA